MEKAHIQNALEAIRNSVLFSKTLVGKMKIAELELKLQHASKTTLIKKEQRQYKDQPHTFLAKNLAERKEAYNHTLSIMRGASHSERIKIVQSLVPKNKAGKEADKARWRCVEENYPEVLISLHFVKRYQKKKEDA
jgi:hypothetical protein